MLEKEIKILFVFAVIFIVLFTYVKATSWNDMSRMATIESVVERGTFAIDDSLYNETKDKVSVNGHFYSEKPVMFTLLSAIFYKGLYTIGIRFSNAEFIVYYTITLLTTGISFLVLLYIIYKTLKLLNIKSHMLLLLLGVCATPIIVRC